MSDKNEFPKFVQRKLNIMNGNIKLEPIKSFKTGQYSIDELPEIKKAIDELFESKKKK